MFSDQIHVMILGLPPSDNSSHALNHNRHRFTFKPILLRDILTSSDVQTTPFETFYAALQHETSHASTRGG